MIVEAACTYEALLSGPSKLSTGCYKFERGKKYELDLSDPEQRKLLTLKWKMGTQEKWIFEFERAKCTNPAESIWFCPECGEYFDKAASMGNHCNSAHQSKLKKSIAAAQAREEEEGIDPDEPVVLKKKLTFRCKTPGCTAEPFPNPRALGEHKKRDHAPAEPVTAEV